MAQQVDPRAHVLPHYINGKWVAPKGDVKTPIMNPATDEVINEVPVATHEEVEQCVASQSWQSLFPLLLSLTLSLLLFFLLFVVFFPFKIHQIQIIEMNRRLLRPAQRLCVLTR